MKKILAVICFGFLSLNFANAERVTLGISGNIGMLEADGKETITGTSERTNTWSEGVKTENAGTETTTSTRGSEDVYIGYLALFGEVHLFDTGLRLGMSYVPYALESETTANTRVDQCGHSGNGTGADAGSARTICSATTQTVQIDVEDLVSTYIAYHHTLDDGLFINSVFVKGGIIEADVITKEKLSSGASYGNAELSGQFFGVGAEKNMDNGLFVRLEAGITEYDSIKLKSSNADVDENNNVIDITGLEGATATFAIGKSF